MKFKFLNCIFLICFIFGGVLYSDEKRQVEEKEVEKSSKEYEEEIEKANEKEVGF